MGDSPCFRSFSSMRQRALYFLLFVIVLVPTACGQGDQNDLKILTVGLEANPTHLDPRFSLDVASARVTQLVFNGLLRKDRRSQIVPDLALRWEHPEPTIYVFHLRQDVQFHNGQPFTSADVAYTFRSILDSTLGSPKLGSYQVIQEIETPDPQTVVFHLKEPFAPFLAQMVAPIVPHQAGKEIAHFREHPIGTGPFQFEDFRSDERVELSAYAEYHEGRPKLDRVVYRIIPDGTVRRLELERGGLDLVVNALLPESLERLATRPHLKIERAPGTNFTYLGFNLQDPILSRPKVRLAFAHAIDRAAIIQHVLKGLARPARSLLAETHWAHAGDVATYPYDPDRARQLLDEAGLQDPDGPGPEPRFRLVFKTSQNEVRRQVAEVIQAQLQQLGVEVQIRSFEWGTFFSDIRSGNFQIFALTWVGVLDPDIYHYIFHSSSVPPSGANRGRYLNPEMDRLLEEGRRLLDLQARKGIYDQVQQILAQDLPYLSLWHSTHVAVMRKEVQGFELYPDESMRTLKEVDLLPGPTTSSSPIDPLANPLCQGCEPLSRPS